MKHSVASVHTCGRDGMLLPANACAVHSLVFQHEQQLAGPLLVCLPSSHSSCQATQQRIVDCLGQVACAAQLHQVVCQHQPGLVVQRSR